MSEAINWAKWKRMHSAPLGTLLCLAVGANPDKRPIQWTETQKQDWLDMLDVALSHVGVWGSRKPLEAEYFDEYEPDEIRAWVVRLDVFARWAGRMDYQLPAGFPWAEITLSGKAFNPSPDLKLLQDFEAQGNKVKLSADGTPGFTGIKAFVQSGLDRDAKYGCEDTIRKRLKRGYLERKAAEREGTTASGGQDLAKAWGEKAT